MIKNFLITSLCVLLSGCISSPEYYGNEQAIVLKYPEGTTLRMEGYEPEVIEEKVKRLIRSGEVKIDGYLNKTERTVKCSSHPLIITLSKEGFEDKTIEIKSHFTDDQWATISHMNGDDEKTSALSLLIPMNTVGYTSVGFVSGAWLMGYSHPIIAIPVGIITIPVGSVAGFIYGLGKDIYNIVIGIPSVVIANPWYEYSNADFTNEILTPTQEFKTMCYSKNDTFIGNNDCLPCSIDTRVVALPEECNRCPGRYMDGQHCVKSCKKGQFNDSIGDCVSCNLEKSVGTSVLSCNQCNNREMKNGQCIKKCDGFHTKDGLCIPCTDKGSYQPYHDEITFNNECYRCPNREMVNNECYLKSK